MPRRKYLDNTIPADNTAQIGKQQVNRAKSARYHKVVPTFSQGSKVPSEFIRTPEAAMAAHRLRSNYYFNQAPTLSNLLHGVVDYLKGNGYTTPTLSAQQYGVAPGVGIGKSSPLRRLSKVSSSARRTPSNQVISEVTGPYTYSQGINVTDPNLLRDEAISYINTGDASPWFKSLYGPFNRQISALPKEVEREYKEVILPRLINAKLAEARFNTKNYRKHRSLMFTKKDATAIERMVRKAAPSLDKYYDYDKVKKDYIIADGKLWDMYNAPHNGRAVAYNNQGNGVMAIDEREIASVIKYIGHEFRHRLDNMFPRTNLMQRLLDKAYNDLFLSIPDNVEGYRSGYDMKPEQVTLNRDLRKAILNIYEEGNTPDILLQNQLIDDASASDILSVLANVSGYGRHYYDAIIDHAMDIDNVKDRSKYIFDLVQYMRNAMKYVGAGTGATTIGHGIYNSYDRNNK